MEQSTIPGRHTWYGSVQQGLQHRKFYVGLHICLIGEALYSFLGIHNFEQHLSIKKVHPLKPPGLDFDLVREFLTNYRTEALNQVLHSKVLVASQAILDQQLSLIRQ